MRYTHHLLRHFRFIIGQNIQRLRTEHRMGLEELALQCHIKPDYLDDYEQGKNNIRLHEMIRIACALNVNVGQLID